MTSILNGRVNGADAYLSEPWDNHGQRSGWLDDETGSATVDFAIVRRIQAEVNAELDRYGQDGGPGLGRGEQRQLAIGLIGERTAAWADAETAAGNPPTQQQEAALAEAVLAAMFGLGRIEQLLRDENVEEIFIYGAAPAIKRFAV
jgi:hypothetical protein